MLFFQETEREKREREETARLDKVLDRTPHNVRMLDAVLTALAVVLGVFIGVAIVVVALVLLK